MLHHQQPMQIPANQIRDANRFVSLQNSELSGVIQQEHHLLLCVFANGDV